MRRIACPYCERAFLVEEDNPKVIVPQNKTVYWYLYTIQAKLGTLKDLMSKLLFRSLLSKITFQEKQRFEHLLFKVEEIEKHVGAIKNDETV